MKFSEAYFKTSASSAYVGIIPELQSCPTATVAFEVENSEFYGDYAGAVVGYFADHTEPVSGAIVKNVTVTGKNAGGAFGYAMNIKGLEKGLNLPKMMVEHVNLHSGDSVQIQFTMGSDNVDALVDWLGKEFTIIEDKAGKLKVKVICNEEAFYKWALQYGEDVEVLQPVDLRKKIASTVAEMSKKYKK